MCAGLSISSQERYSLSLVTDTRLRSGRRTINVARLWTLHGDDWVDEYATSALTAPRNAESLSRKASRESTKSLRSLSSSRAATWTRTATPCVLQLFWPGDEADDALKYMYHAGADFDTAKGIEITQSMDVVANSDAFNLTYQFGVAPHCAYSLVRLCFLQVADLHSQRSTSAATRPRPSNPCSTSWSRSSSRCSSTDWIGRMRT